MLEYTFLNNFYQLGLKNLLDVAVLRYVELELCLDVYARFQKVDGLPFDFKRRCMSVMLTQNGNIHMLICKGAVEKVLTVSACHVSSDETGPLEASHLEVTRQLVEDLSTNGLRIVTITYKGVPPG